MNAENNNQAQVIAATVRVRMAILGMNPVRVAAAAGVSLPTVYNVLNGAGVQSVRLFRILRALGLEIEVKEAA